MNLKFLKGNPNERGLKLALIGLAVMVIGYLVQFTGVAVVPALIAWTGFLIGMIGGAIHLYIVVKNIKSRLGR